MNPEDGDETFLRRWSRVKSESHGAAQAPDRADPVPQPKTDDLPPELPPIEKLTIDSDFSGFFHPKVDEDVRRGALKKLFSDPRFNVMDGLDVYIDDYSKSDPIPAAMLASLKQAQRILEWAADTDDAAAGTQRAEQASIEHAGASGDEAVAVTGALEDLPAQRLTQTASDDPDVQSLDRDRAIPARKS